MRREPLTGNTGEDFGFVKLLAELANETRAVLDGTTKPIKRIFEENEIIYAIWQDTTRPYGVDFFVLKGTKLLKEIGAGNENVAVRIAAVPCECYEQAFVTKQMSFPKISSGLGVASSGRIIA